MSYGKKEAVWVRGSWEGKNFPQRVKLVLGESVLIGKMIVPTQEEGWKNGYRLEVEELGATMVVANPGLWALYVEAQVPTKAGAYKGSTGGLWVLDEEGVWWDCSMWTPYKHGVGPVNYLPLTRLSLVGGGEE